MGHLAWRKTFHEHTFAHRIQQICRTIGIEHDWMEYPKASLITPTFRRDLLPRCMQTYEQQTYPNKELVLVFNGPDKPSYEELGQQQLRSDVKIVNVPGEMFAGACLNQGHILAQGEYCFRVDDDDYYGDNYILDMILQTRSIEADIFGKPPAPIYFGDDQKVYVRNTTPPLAIVSKNLLESGRQWVGGNSIAGKKNFFVNNKYEDSAFGGADTNLLFKIMGKDNITYCLMDQFNLVAQRRNDKKTHTWKIEDEKIKKNCHHVYSDINSTFL
jgi:glycosyltransferase involved in cell wall biosynthesis